MPSAAEQLAANFNLSAFGKATELKQRLLFTLIALIVARLGTYVPMPGIDAAVLAQQLQQQQGGILQVFNVLAGGAIERMAIFALGIMPYISASIIIQLMTSVVPSLETLKKEGEQGEGEQDLAAQFRDPEQQRELLEHTRASFLGAGRERTPPCTGRAA